MFIIINTLKSSDYARPLTIVLAGGVGSRLPSPITAQNLRYAAQWQISDHRFHAHELPTLWASPNSEYWLSTSLTLCKNTYVMVGRCLTPSSANTSPMFPHKCEPVIAGIAGTADAIYQNLYLLSSAEWSQACSGVVWRPYLSHGLRANAQATQTEWSPLNGSVYGRFR